MKTIAKLLVILLPVLALGYFPSPARAQRSLLTIYYDGAALYGSASYQSDPYCIWPELKITMWIYKPLGQFFSLGNVESWDCPIESNWWYNSVDQFGTYDVQAAYSYLAGYNWVTDWTDYEDYFVDLQPTGESSQYNLDVTAGASFYATLSPYTYTGGWVQPTVENVSDGCYSALPTGPEISPVTGGATVDIVNQYEDVVVDSGGSDWVDYYNAAIAAHVIGSCSWSGGESLTFNGGSQYAYVSTGQSVDGASTTTTRGGASHTASWAP